MRKTKNSELGRINIEEFKETKKTAVTIILDNIRSLNNIGSVFRTADAFLIEEIHLCGITATPPHRDIQKTALGATESVNWKYFSKTVESIELLRKNNYSIIAVEQADESIYLDQFSPEKNKKLAKLYNLKDFSRVKRIASEKIGLQELKLSQIITLTKNI